MAGGDQSVNLSGMLNSIAGTIGSGYEINGMSAGQALGNNIREAAKPKLDMNDPQSIRDYAGWAGRNGQQKESTLMLEKAAEVEKEQAIAKKKGAVAKDTAMGMKSAADGDVTGLERAIADAARKAQEAGQAGDLDGVDLYRKEMEALSGQRNAAKGVQTTNKGNGILHLESLLENPDVTEEQKRQIQTQLDVLKQDNKAVLAANNTKISNMAVERQQQAAQEDALEAEAMTKIMAIKDPDELLDLELPPEIAGKLQGVISSRESMLVRQEQRNEKDAELTQATFNQADREFFEGLAAEAGDGVDFDARMTTIEEAQKKAMKDGKWNSEAERLAFLKTQARFENEMFNQYAAATSQEGRLRREAEDRAVLAYEEAKLEALAGPSPSQIDDFKKGRRDMTDEEARRGVQTMLNQRRDNLRPRTEQETKTKEEFLALPVPADVPPAKTAQNAFKKFMENNYEKLQSNFDTDAERIEFALKQLGMKKGTPGLTEQEKELTSSVGVGSQSTDQYAPGRNPYGM